MGETLSFPSPKPRDQAKAKELALNLRPPMAFETIDRENTQSLLKVVQGILEKSKELIDFVDADREVARKAGVETIAIELSVMMFSDRLDRVLDALESSAARGKPSQISMEGLANIRRMERLLAEANSQIVKNTGKASLPAPQSVMLAQAVQKESSDTWFWMPILIVGAFGLGAILITALVSGPGKNPA
jgi:hypothetical protein